MVERSVRGGEAARSIRVVLTNFGAGCGATATKAESFSVVPATNVEGTTVANRAKRIAAMDRAIKT